MTDDAGAATPIRIDVWSDVLCPWCYVAARRLTRIVHDESEPVEVRWRAFLLQPDPTPKPLDRFRRYTERWLAPGGPAELEPEAGFRVWDGDARPPTHSLPPATAVKAAERMAPNPDAAEKFHLALMHAYFAEHRDVSARDTVIAVAGACGLDVDAFVDVLDTQGAALHIEVVDDHAEAIDRGIFAVPTIVVAGGPPLPAVQEPDAYRRVITRARQR